MKSFFKEFKEFITQGSVLNMAIGIIIGGAFTAIITALVEHIIMPIISIFMGGYAIEDIGIHLKNGGVIGIGMFLQAIITFILIALVLFCIIKAINKAGKKKDEAPTTKVCPFCKTDIAIEATRCPNCTSEQPKE